MTKKQKRALARILTAGAVYLALLIVLHFVEVPGWAELLLYAVPYAIVGWDVLWNAVRGIAHGQLFDESFLMMVASLAAFAVGESVEAVAVMLFYQVGELFQSVAVERSRRSIKGLMDICPEYANVEVDGVLTQVDPDEVEIGTEIVIRPGERVPLDGVIVSGSSMLDTAALTGESVPRRAAPGDAIISGCINGASTLRVRTTKAFEDSTVSKILELVENAADKKANVERFITRFARWYTPAVVIAAVLLAVVPPLFVGGWGDWIARACTFLVISCPCALVISVPLSLFGGIGAASGQGILIKGGNFLEAAAKLDTVVFDKTGTLTKGTFCVTERHPAPGVPEEKLLETAALAEAYADHPIAASIRAAWGGSVEASRVTNAEVVAGRGVRAELDGVEVLAGNAALLAPVAAQEPDSVGTVVHVALAGAYLGCLVIADEVRPDAGQAVAELKQLGVRQTVMLTGDRRSVGEAVGRQLGLDAVHAELLPADKVEQVERLLRDKRPDGYLAFVGDGLNDAPVLSRADVGIAMGGIGSDAAIEAADIVLMDDKPSKLALTVRIARRTMRIARQNIVFALAVKAVVLVLGALGYASMWAAVFSDVGVAVIAILNAMRAMKVR